MVFGKQYKQEGGFQYLSDLSKSGDKRLYIDMFSLDLEYWDIPRGVLSKDDLLQKFRDLKSIPMTIGNGHAFAYSGTHFGSDTMFLNPHYKKSWFDDDGEEKMLRTLEECEKEVSCDRDWHIECFSKKQRNRIKKEYKHWNLENGVPKKWNQVVFLRNGNRAIYSGQFNQNGEYQGQGKVTEYRRGHQIKCIYDVVHEKGFRTRANMFKYFGTSLLYRAYYFSLSDYMWS